MASGKSPRRRAREFVIQGLYQWQVGDQDEAAIQVQAESVAGFDKADRELYLALLRRVIINEAIELAKTYGGTDGHKFVNGVLDKLASGLRAAEIRKP